MGNGHREQRLRPCNNLIICLSLWQYRDGIAGELVAHVSVTEMV